MKGFGENQLDIVVGAEPSPFSSRALTPNRISGFFAKRIGVGLAAYKMLRASAFTFG